MEYTICFYEQKKCDLCNDLTEWLVQIGDQSFSFCTEHSFLTKDELYSQYDRISPVGMDKNFFFSRRTRSNPFEDITLRFIKSENEY